MAGRLRIGTVLCVDDEVDALGVRKEVLEMRGYKVLTAPNAEEALKLFDSADVDVVLTDDLLVRGQTGTALAAEMKRRKPGVPAAIYSGVSQVPGDIGKADAFIAKLVTPEELLEYLAVSIPRRHAARAPRTKCVNS